VTGALALEPLGPDHLSRVVHLRVTEAQAAFSGQVQDAFRSAEEGVDFHAILEGGQAAGFFKIDRLYAARFRFARQGEIGLRGFLVDRSRQGRGLATRAIGLMHAYLPPLYRGQRASS
jgi:GNAT superfamily N-acetyltransferase